MRGVCSELPFLKPSTLNCEPSTLNPQPSTLNPQPSTPNQSAECEECAVGFYSAEAGGVQCFLCPEGSDTLGTGSAECIVDKCLLGTHDCDSKASCLISNSSDVGYTCACPQGFPGLDGVAGGETGSGGGKLGAQGVAGASSSSVETGRRSLGRGEGACHAVCGDAIVAGEQPLPTDSLPETRKPKPGT